MELHNLIRKSHILPYLTGSFHPSIIEEYVDGLLMTLQKQDGGILPILCEEIWRRCFASLTVNATPVGNEAAKLFTSTYDNFIQTAGIRDGPRIARRSPQFSIIVLIPLILMIPK